MSTGLTSVLLWEVPSWCSLGGGRLLGVNDSLHFGFVVLCCVALLEDICRDGAVEHFISSPAS